VTARVNRRILRVVLVAALSFFPACSGISPTVVTAATLEATKTTYVSTAGWFFARCSPTGTEYEKHVVPENVCQSWADFAKRFKATYVTAATLWDAAAVIDPTSQTKAGEILATLSADLATFVALVPQLQAAYSPPDGGR
jgi:hypothetical protein